VGNLLGMVKLKKEEEKMIIFLILALNPLYIISSSRGVVNVNQKGVFDNNHFELLASAKSNEGRKIYILVDMGIYSSIAEAIATYMDDMTQDGYNPVLWGVLGATPQDIQGLLSSGYEQGVEGAVFIGDVPAPLCKIGENLPYPTDYYYMDLDGNWEWEGDTIVGYTGDNQPEIYVGRIFPNRSAGNDTTLINDYFTLNHRWRNNEVQLENKYRALGFYDECEPWKKKGFEEFLQYAFSDVEVWEWKGQGYEDSTIKYYYADASSPWSSQISREFEVVSVMVHGSEKSHFFQVEGNKDNKYEVVTSSDIERCNSSYFYELNSCYNGSFTTQDYLAGTYLFLGRPALRKTLGVIALTTSGNTCGLPGFYEHVGKGIDFGRAYMFSSNVATVFLGDPTLKLCGYSYGVPEYAGFPIGFPGAKGVVFADIDLDHKDEIICYTENAVVLMELSGEIVWEYSFGGSYRVYKPVVADIDNNGTMEIVLGINNGLTGGKVIYLSNDGAPLHEINIGLLIGSPPAVFDFNSDGKKEIVVTFLTFLKKEKGSKILEVYNSDGEKIWEYHCSMPIYPPKVSVGKPSHYNGLVFNSNDTLVCVGFRNGSFNILWKQNYKVDGLSMGDVDPNINGDEILAWKSDTVWVISSENGNVLASYVCNAPVAYAQFAQIDPSTSLMEILVSLRNGLVKSFYYLMVPYNHVDISYTLPKRAVSTSCVGDCDEDSYAEVIIPGTRGEFFIDHDNTSLMPGDFFGPGSQGDGMLVDVEGDGEEEYGFSDILGNIHLFPLNRAFSRVQWTESYADRWNTRNASDYIPPYPPVNLKAELHFNRISYVHLRWARNKDLDIDHYNVYEKVSGDTFRFIGSTPDTNFYRKDMGPFTQYYVTALDKSGNESSKSNTVSPAMPFKAQMLNPEVEVLAGLDAEIKITSSRIYINNLSNKNTVKGKIKVINIVGRVINCFDVYCNPREETGFVLNLPSGVYFLDMGLNNKRLIKRIAIIK